MLPQEHAACKQHAWLGRVECYLTSIKHMHVCDRGPSANLIWSAATDLQKLVRTWRADAACNLLPASAQGCPKSRMSVSIQVLLASNQEVLQEATPCCWPTAFGGIQAAGGGHCRHAWCTISKCLPARHRAEPDSPSQCDLSDTTLFAKLQAEA